MVAQGMWAKPDSMAAMMTQKSGHVDSGASNAWVRRSSFPQWIFVTVWSGTIAHCVHVACAALS
jgi:hypothetical protein